VNLDAGSMLASLLVSTIGMAVLWYGRKQRRIPQVAIGLLMLVFPFFVSNTWLMLGIGATLLALLWLAVRMGL
jgi:hypothetical protein